MKRFACVLTAVFFFTSAIFAEGQKEKESGDAEIRTLVVAVQKLPIAAISAMAENSNVALRIDFSIEETLIKTDYYDNYSLKPGLAESWEMVDEQTLIFHLRQGVLFHNGEEMTAEDVTFTFGNERLMGENAPARETTNPFLYNIDSVIALDTYTVEIKSLAPDAMFLTRFANFPTQIISKKGYIDAGSWEAFGRMPVGTGPYKIVEYKDDLKVVIERFDDYWGDATAAVDQVEFRFVPELSTRIAGLRTGEFDMITEIPPDQAAAIDTMSGVRIQGGAIRNIYGMFFDETNDSPMHSPLVREALTISINREMLVDTLFSGLTTIPNNWQMKLFGDMYLEAFPGVEYNPERAKTLLKEAGYDGELIVYRSLPGYYSLEQTVAEAVTQMWQDVGINIDLRIKENWAQITEDNEYRNIINGSFTAYYPDPVGQLWRRFGVNSGKAQGAYWTNSEEFNNLGHVLETSYNLETRREAFREMMEIFNQDPKGLYLYNLPMIYGVREGIEWSPLPIEGMDFTTNALVRF